MHACRVRTCNNRPHCPSLHVSQHAAFYPTHAFAGSDNLPTLPQIQKPCICFQKHVLLPAAAALIFTVGRQAQSILNDSTFHLLCSLSPLLPLAPILQDLLALRNKHSTPCFSPDMQQNQSSSKQTIMSVMRLL